MIRADGTCRGRRPFSGPGGRQSLDGQFRLRSGPKLERDYRRRCSHPVGSLVVSIVATRSSADVKEIDEADRIGRLPTPDSSVATIGISFRSIGVERMSPVCSTDIQSAEAGAGRHPRRKPDGMVAIEIVVPEPTIAYAGSGCGSASSTAVKPRTSVANSGDPVPSASNGAANDINASIHGKNACLHLLGKHSDPRKAPRAT